MKKSGIHIAGEAEYYDLLEYLRRDRGFTVSAYRDSYIARRITSRLCATGCSSVSEYIRFLESSQNEIIKLYDSLTINVSSFFRNKEVFDFLRKHVFPSVAKKKIIAGQNTINIWSVGCSTGEEPYSIAILINRYLKVKLNKFRIKILAVDIDSKALKTAKKGIYPSGKLEGIDPKIIRSCFNKRGEKYQISDPLRNMVDFQLQDIVEFKLVELNFDLILCRNMLIYLNRKNHIKAYKYFSRCLDTGGFLVLGKAEVMFFPKENHFDYASIDNRVYQKTG